MPFVLLGKCFFRRGEREGERWKGIMGTAHNDLLRKKASVQWAEGKCFEIPPILMALYYIRAFSSRCDCAWCPEHIKGNILNKYNEGRLDDWTSIILSLAKTGTLDSFLQCTTNRKIWMPKNGRAIWYESATWGIRPSKSSEAIILFLVHSSENYLIRWDRSGE